MNNVQHKIPTYEEVRQALKDADKNMIFTDVNDVPQAIYEIIRPAKKSSLSDDSWDNNYPD